MGSSVKGTASHTDLTILGHNFPWPWELFGGTSAGQEEPESLTGREIPWVHSSEAFRGKLMVQLPPVALLSLLSTLGTLREQRLHSQKAAAAAGRCCRGSRAAGENPGSLGPGGEPRSPGPAVIASRHFGCMCGNLPAQTHHPTEEESNSEEQQGVFACF